MHDAGVELFNRFVKVMELIAEVGASLGKTVEKYNATIRSIDTRLWPKGEEMQRMAGSGKELGTLDADRSRAARVVEAAAARCRGPSLVTW